MRLLDTSDLTFSEFPDSRSVEYAILSHRWYDSELTHQEMLLGRFSATKQQSYEKVRSFCAVAKNHGFAWAWVDTVCIDKTSSADLQESINSMWSWYQDTGRCIAYLSDVSQVSEADMRRSTPGGPRRLSPPAYDTFCRSEWFQRGWTLQELLAPSHVSFCNAEWIEIGTKWTLTEEIHDTTNISGHYLRNTSSAQYTSIARRMSWAASRRTTRVEDRAYSLLGLFNVNMPLLYGEGDKAFLRLQLEILQQTEDESIFAWSRAASHGNDTWGLLAPSAEAFERSSHVNCFPLPQYRPSFRMTHKGLKVRLPAILYTSDLERETAVVSTQDMPKNARAGDRMDVQLHCGHEGPTMYSAAEGFFDYRHPVYISLIYSTDGWQRTDLGSVNHCGRGQPATATHEIYIKQPGMHTPWPLKMGVDASGVPVARS